MAKIKIEKDIYEKAKKVAETAGYSSVDEFVVHILERELQQLLGDDDGEDDEKVKERLKGLGYIS
jgi:hypothetical protein